MKILLILLDEDAASAPTRNKAELLYNDESGTSILTLFRYVIWKLCVKALTQLFFLNKKYIVDHQRNLHLW